LILLCRRVEIQRVIGPRITINKALAPITPIMGALYFAIWTVSSAICLAWVVCRSTNRLSWLRGLRISRVTAKLSLNLRRKYRRSAFNKITLSRSVTKGSSGKIVDIFLHFRKVNFPHPFSGQCREKDTDDHKAYGDEQGCRQWANYWRKWEDQAKHQRNGSSTKCACRNCTITEWPEEYMACVI